MECNTTKKSHTINIKSLIRLKDFSEGFDDLTPKEKKYALHFNRASWSGALICFHQVSYESPVLFCLSQFLFANQNPKKLKQNMKEKKIEEKDFSRFLAYFAGVLHNFGNYSSYGHKKFIPDLSPETFIKIIKSFSHFEEFEEAFGCSFESLWGKIDKEVFALESPFASIGLPGQGISGYFSSSFSEDELNMVKRFLLSQKQSPLNTRCFKKIENEKQIFEITVASIEHSEEEVNFEGNLIRVVHGEFSEYLKELNSNLQKALSFTRSQLQADMLRDYISHFQNGDVNLHIESQKKWIQDKSPTIETNIGFIETYLDPQGIRAYFEGLVSIVNKQRSKKYTELVEAYPEIIKHAPWPSTFCKDKFQRPDFTSLDVISFAGPGCPIGINIPNYDLVRNDFGFKNVFLANNMKTSGERIESEMLFLSKKDSALLAKYGSSSYTLLVALHELIGHGSGKLFFSDEHGKLNFDPENTFDLLTGEKVSSHYKHGQTWAEVFGKVNNSFEECRADVCGIYLGFVPRAYKIFGFSKNEIQDVMACTVLDYMREAIEGLRLFNCKTEKWGQAHTQGAFVFVSFLLKNQDPQHKVLDILLSAQEDDFRYFLDRDQLMTQGRQLVGQLLKHLQQYKSCAQHEKGKKFYQTHSEVSPFFRKIRKIVLANQKPRALDMYNQLRLNKNQEVLQVKNTVSHLGLLTAHAGHWIHSRNELIQMVMREWNFRGNSSTLRVS